MNYVMPIFNNAHICQYTNVDLWIYKFTDLRRWYTLLVYAVDVYIVKSSIVYQQIPGSIRSFSK
jgi:hypothetical protein